MKKTIYMAHYNGKYFIRAVDERGYQFASHEYLWYSKREALKLFREQFNLVGLHFKHVVENYCPFDYGYMY